MFLLALVTHDGLLVEGICSSVVWSITYVKCEDQHVLHNHDWLPYATKLIYTTFKFETMS